jgi:hypothetical protein
LSLAAFLALEEPRMRQAQQRPVVRVHRRANMQINPPPPEDSTTVVSWIASTWRSRQRGPRRSAARAAISPGLTLGLRGKRSGESLPPDPRPTVAPYSPTARRNQTGVQKRLPFSRRRSPNRSSETSDMPNLPNHSGERIRVPSHPRTTMCECHSFEGGGRAAQQRGRGCPPRVWPWASPTLRCQRDPPSQGEGRRRAHPFTFIDALH